MEASQLGLEIDGVLGQAYLVPFNIKKKIDGKFVSYKEATLIPGYRGLMSLVNNTDRVQTVNTAVVYSSDAFSYALGSDPFVQHIPAEGGPPTMKNDKGEDVIDFSQATHVYATVRLINGGTQVSVMSKEAVDIHKRRFSKAWRQAEEPPYWDKTHAPLRDSAWHTDWDKMARKTVLRDMIARGELAVSSTLQRAIMQEQKIEVQDAIDITATRPSVTIEEPSLAGITQALEEEQAPEPEKKAKKPRKGTRDWFLLQVAEAENADQLRELNTEANQKLNNPDDYMDIREAAFIRLEREFGGGDL